MRKRNQPTAESRLRNLVHTQEAKTNIDFVSIHGITRGQAVILVDVLEDRFAQLEAEGAFRRNEDLEVAWLSLKAAAGMAAHPASKHCEITEAMNRIITPTQGVFNDV